MADILAPFAPRGKELRVRKTVIAKCKLQIGILHFAIPLSPKNAEENDAPKFALPTIPNHERLSFL
jgi:hypothetical protein